MTSAPLTIRLDKWLWHARFFKTRSLAAKVVSDGKVRVNSRRVNKPATPVRIGDGITFALSGQVFALRVIAFGLRRGPAPEARQLYINIDEVRGQNAPEPLEHMVEIDK